MKDTLYTRSVDKIKAPQTMLDKSLCRMRSVNSESEVIVMKKSKRKIIKFTSAIAAALAVTIAIGAVYLSPKKDTEHPFMLTVNAAEITPETYIQIGKLEAYDGSSSYKSDVIRDKDGNIIQKLPENLDLEKSCQEFGINIQCSGENIESITYTAHNCYLNYDLSYEGTIKTLHLTNEELKKYDAPGALNNYIAASSVTYAYDMQSQSSLDYEVLEYDTDVTYPLRLAFTIFFEEDEHIFPNDENISNNTAKVFSETFNENAKIYSLDITANFKDGTKATKTLTFRSEFTDNNRLLFYAKETV